MRRFLVVDAVALTPALLRSGVMPRLSAWAETRRLAPLAPSLPAVTCTGHADLLCGAPPRVHGAVGNGWYFRDLAEVWLWRQSAALLQAPTIFDRWREAAPAARTAQLFWWWNLPSRADLSLTPRPTYWADGRKGPDVHSWPPELRRRLRRRLGDFPLFQFWGPGAGIRSTRWIVDAVLDVLAEERPALTLAYLPHLDYDLQRFGPEGPEARRAAAELDAELARLLARADADGIETIVLSGYGIEPVARAAFPNRALREAGLLAVHPAANGALLDPGRSRAFAVCDHQCAHVYVAAPADRPAVRALLAGLEGVAEVLEGAELAARGLDHPRSGELFLLAAPGWWFAYPYWAGDDAEPDFARTVDIHRKPGYDPCELFLDPARPLLKARLALKLLAKAAGFRTVFDVVPLDPGLVRGSHGRPPASPERGPLWLGPAELLPSGAEPLPAWRALERVTPAESP
ncbi:MAG: alkaline phosphatase family protein [Planctomycetota bacterium]|nr:MAG: alkaline phosphatase family protein [Planctomycetota bacterium]